LDNVEVATKDAYVTDDLGVRRKVVAGAPIPAHLATELKVETEALDKHEHAAPIVDEEASLSQAERTKRSSGGGSKSSTSKAKD
jgi:hypothetical protein